MFPRLFAQAGLSMERLRALVEIGAHGSIVKAAHGEPTRQSLYSRQIKELEDFFGVPLLERHGRSVRLTTQGRELARISRFFLLGLSNFQRGCLAEGQAYRIGADATCNRCFLLPVLSEASPRDARLHYTIETVGADEVERRLHDLTLDFGILTRGELSRPLQTRELARWPLSLWVPRSLAKNGAGAERALRQGRLPFVWPTTGLECYVGDIRAGAEPALVCPGFVEVRDALSSGTLAGILPEFLQPAEGEKRFFKLSLNHQTDPVGLGFWFAWNPRLLRLNPHAARRRDALIASLLRRVGPAVTRRKPVAQTRDSAGDSPPQSA